MNNEKKCNCGINSHYITREDSGNYKRQQCIRCGYEIIIFRNSKAKFDYYNKIKNDKILKVTINPQEKLFKLFNSELL